jgi:hypothetical protein
VPDANKTKKHSEEKRRKAQLKTKLLTIRLIIFLAKSGISDSCTRFITNYSRQVEKENEINRKQTYFQQEILSCPS